MQKLSGLPFPMQMLTVSALPLSSGPLTKLKPVFRSSLVFVLVVLCYYYILFIIIIYLLFIYLLLFIIYIYIYIIYVLVFVLVVVCKISEEKPDNSFGFNLIRDWPAFNVS